MEYPTKEAAGVERFGLLCHELIREEALAMGDDHAD